MINVMNLLWGFKFEPLGETPVDTWAYQKAGLAQRSRNLDGDVDR